MKLIESRLDLGAKKYKKQNLVSDGRDFVNEAAPMFGMKIEWRGKGLDEFGFDLQTNRTVIKVSDKYFRPTEVESLLGDATKAKEKLGWKPKITFKQLVEDMCIYGQ